LEANYLKNIDWELVLRKIKELASSDLAKDEIDRTAPLGSAAEALNQFRQIEEAAELIEVAGRTTAESLNLFPLWFERLKKSAVLNGVELKDARLFFIEVLALKQILSQSSGTWVQQIKAQLLEAKRPISAIDQVLTPDGSVRSDASETLYNLIQRKKDFEREVRNHLDTLVKKHDLEPVLRDRFVTTREGRWVVPVKSGMQHQLKGIIHDSSQSKQTVFIEPEEVVKTNNELRKILSAIDEEIHHLFKELSKMLETMIEEIKLAHQCLLDCDIRFAQAQFARLVEARSVTFSDGELFLHELRHPILELEKKEGPRVVSNTVELSGERRILLLSGPNAGGKTVLLKSVGLACHMARCGLLPVCDANSRIPFFRRIYAVVGDSQSVSEHISTFAAHLKALNEILELPSASPQLVLVDEICGATDPEEGAALAKSFIMAYEKMGSFGVVTSHLGPIKKGWETNKGVLPGSMEYSDEAGGATYRLILGAHGRSMALKVAEKVGVNHAIVERAQTFLSPESQSLHKAMKEIEANQSELNAMRKDLQKERSEAENSRREYLRLIDDLNKEKATLLEDLAAKSEQKLLELIDQAKKSDDRIKGLEQLKSQMPEIIKGPQRSEIANVQDFLTQNPVGSRVYIPHLAKDAIIQGVANQKGEIPVLAGSMRLSILWSQLKPNSLPDSVTRKVIRETGFQMPIATQAERTIDLRGFRIEKALEELELQLDRAMQAQTDKVRIIHGHGTEALKRAVRTYLARSIYIKKWRAGDTEATGDDGVTFAELG